MNPLSSAQTGASPGKKSITLTHYFTFTTCVPSYLCCMLIVLLCAVQVMVLPYQTLQEHGASAPPSDSSQTKQVRHVHLGFPTQVHQHSLMKQVSSHGQSYIFGHRYVNIITKQQNSDTCTSIKQVYSHAQGGSDTGTTSTLINEAYTLSWTAIF